MFVKFATMSAVVLEYIFFAPDAAFLEFMSLCTMLKAVFELFVSFNQRVFVLKQRFSDLNSLSRFLTVAII